MTLKILLVEDNPLNQELARDLLEAAGHRVAVAGDGDGLRTQIATETIPDIVIMDVPLPGADGVTLLRELRDSPRLALAGVGGRIAALRGGGIRRCSSRTCSTMRSAIRRQGVASPCPEAPWVRVSGS